MPPLRGLMVCLVRTCYKEVAPNGASARPSDCSSSQITLGLIAQINQVEGASSKHFRGRHLPKRTVGLGNKETRRQVNHEGRRCCGYRDGTVRCKRAGINWTAGRQRRASGRTRGLQTCEGEADQQRHTIDRANQNEGASACASACPSVDVVARFHGQPCEIRPDFRQPPLVPSNHPIVPRLARPCGRRG